MNKKLECILAENNGLVRNRLDDMYRWGIKRNDTIFMDFTSPETPELVTYNIDNKFLSYQECLDRGIQFIETDKQKI